MTQRGRSPRAALDPEVVEDWLAATDDALGRYRRADVAALIRRVAERAGVDAGGSLETDHVNTISPEDEPDYPGDRELERRIKNLVRWNAMAMVVRANREHSGIGGHISTYASCATLYEVAFHHFLRAPSDDHPGDLVYFQGHASPGVYARAFLEGRLEAEHLERFRQESGDEEGLSSYPHPWLMPEFWQFPTVSMGLGPIQAIYQARFARYLAHRGLADTDPMRVWCFLGDGECDEPESLAGLALAAREKLDNLTFVVNCNLQRLDGPVRGNGSIIGELETRFRGDGWNVIKVVWGSNWDPLLEADESGALVRRMNETVDGQYQTYSASSGKVVREEFFGASDELAELVADMSDEELAGLKRGGHDPQKVYAAYRAAVEHEGAPTVILAHTVKGYGLGEAGEGRNITHQQKKLNEEELRAFRRRFSVPIEDEVVDEAPFYRPDEDSEEVAYLRERREALGGWLPKRVDRSEPLEVPDLDAFSGLLEGSGDRDVATTMAFVRMLRTLLDHDELGDRVVPIIPDEARTFGMDALFAKYGIYSAEGQRYRPVDRKSLLHYREATDGQVLEEGITEAGSMGSFIAAGSAHASYGIEMIPFYSFYSMFGFQRVGDLIWAAADARCRGFLMGGTAGRTTLSGEGLQHQDGHSHLMAAAVPTVVPYDPAYAYELAVVLQDGLRRMLTEQEPVLYYVTMYNETYPMPAMPEGVEGGIRRGAYSLSSTEGDERVQILASGPMVRQALEAQELLAQEYEVGSDVWSVTSYTVLRREAQEVERWNRMHPRDEPRTSYLEETLAEREGPFVATSDWMTLVPEQIARWLPDDSVYLGTDGFGRSDTRARLRRYFEVDAAHVAYGALVGLARRGSEMATEVLPKAADRLGIDQKETKRWT